MCVCAHALTLACMCCGKRYVLLEELAHLADTKKLGHRSQVTLSSLLIITMDKNIGKMS